MRFHLFIFTLLIVGGATSSSQAQITDTLSYLINGLSYDKRPNLDQYKGVRMAGEQLLASQRFRFTEMLPASPHVLEQQIFYLLPESYRGQYFDAPSLHSRSQKAAVFLLDFPPEELRILENQRRLVPPRGGKFVRWKDGMSFKGQTVIVIPKL